MNYEDFASKLELLKNELDKKTKCTPCWNYPLGQYKDIVRYIFLSGLKCTKRICIIKYVHVQNGLYNIKIYKLLRSSHREIIYFKTNWCSLEDLLQAVRLFYITGSLPELIKFLESHKKHGGTDDDFNILKT